jgi:hypothetical protein
MARGSISFFCYNMRLPRTIAIWITRDVKTYKEEDDVFQSGFLTTVLFWHDSATNLTVNNEAIAYLQQQGATDIFIRQATSRDKTIAPGPYYYAAGCLRAIWKLYEDTHNAFLQPLVVDRKGRVNDFLALMQC